jgi:hypothetical protein
MDKSNIRMEETTTMLCQKIHRPQSRRLEGKREERWIATSSSGLLSKFAGVPITNGVGLFTFHRKTRRFLLFLYKTTRKIEGMCPNHSKKKRQIATRPEDGRKKTKLETRIDSNNNNNIEKKGKKKRVKK